MNDQERKTLEMALKALEQGVAISPFDKSVVTADLRAALAAPQEGADDPTEGGRCSVCRGLTRYGSRHHHCGQAVMALEAEIERLNKWCDEFSDAQLTERAACEAHLQAMRDAIGQIALRLAKDSTFLGRHKVAEELLSLARRAA